MTIILFLAALALLILSHELGHFVSAKISKMRVDEFGFGFPPRLFKFKKGGTFYSINLIPFGGFVKIFGEDGSEKELGSFSSRPVYQRAIVLAAGVFFNLLLAWLLFSLVFAAGAPSPVEEGVESAKITVLEVQSGTPAMSAGLQSGDQLLKFSYGSEILEVKKVKEVQDFIAAHKGQKVKINYARGKDLFETEALLNPNPEPGKGSLGIAMENIGIVRLPFYKAVWEGLKSAVFITGAIIQAFVKLISDLVGGRGAAVQVMGPVGIVGVVGSASEYGFVYVIQLIALLSINLAIINFLPFPALDGGRLLFLVIETIKGSPLNQKFANYANTIGFLILIGLMLLVTFKDVSRLF